ncbi:acyl-CoA carboxylase epsilon subunit [Geodermatophilus sp. SYSU D00703]
MDPAPVSIVRGEPTAEELAALLAVLQACAPPPRPPAGPAPVRRAPRGPGRPWQGPASWSPGPRAWSPSRQ